MRAHIDWLTFTLRLDMSEDGDYANGIEKALDALLGRALLATLFDGTTSPKQRGRAPYADAWATAATDGSVLCTVYAGISLPHFCVEVGGKGCERLIELGVMERILDRVHGSVTRLDVACDIETMVAPTEFVGVTTHERMRSSGFQKSETGETCYVGSQKSERYARVYRYFEPHPRAHLLRVEHVFRRENAKVVAAAIVEHGIEACAASAGEVFGWGHAVWKPGVADVPEIAVVAPERGMGKTVSWLVTSVAPAFQRLVREGVIKNPEAFIQRYFMPEV